MVNIFQDKTINCHVDIYLVVGKGLKYTAKEKEKINKINKSNKNKYKPNQMRQINKWRNKIKIHT